MDLGISGKRAVVAASSAGLGLASARALAAEGVQVAICGRSRDRVDAALETLPAVPTGDHAGLVADVGSADGATSFVERAVAALGGIDVLVPNAGGPPPGNFASTPLDAYLPALQLNLLSTVAMCQAAVPALVDQGWGRIIAITSHSVRQPVADLILSNTTRAGATGFLKTLATEIARHGVTVNSVQPGVHATDRMRQLHAGAPGAAASGVPTGVVGRPEDFGAVVAFLCSDHARFITGTAVPVDGGAFQSLQ
ncbi:MAG TPA: SDR family oxidoreductase [Acidimicrobiales bacterium]|nr:SDR family oxidoreductase [Acidimicrobiales bacterium]